MIEIPWSKKKIDCCPTDQSKMIDHRFLIGITKVFVQAFTLVRRPLISHPEVLSEWTTWGTSRQWTWTNEWSKSFKWTKNYTATSYTLFYHKLLDKFTIFLLPLHGTLIKLILGFWSHIISDPCNENKKNELKNMLLLEKLEIYCCSNVQLLKN